MIASSYLLCFLISIVFSLISTRWVRGYAIKRGWVSGPELDRHVHTKSVPRLGGVAIFGSFVAVASLATLFANWAGLPFLLPTRTLFSIFGSALIIFLLGLYDDLHVVGPYWKFGVQALAAVFLYIGGVGIHHLDLFSAGRDRKSVV